MQPCGWPGVTLVHLHITLQQRTSNFPLATVRPLPSEGTCGGGLRGDTSEGAGVKE